MTTEYQNTVTIAVPKHLMEVANHLACALGEASEDINTFSSVNFTDGADEYSVVHTVVKDIFLEPVRSGSIPPDPPHSPPSYSRDKALEAFSKLNVEGGILFAYNVDPETQLGEWGMTRIEEKDPA